MSSTVRQSIQWAIVGLFLVGDFALAAAFWRPFANLVVALAATGALVAEPMLLGLWFGFARQPLMRRLLITVGLSSIGATLYYLGVWLVDSNMQSDFSLAASIYLLFLAGGVGSTVLGGIVFRAHRSIAGVLTIDEELSGAHCAAPMQDGALLDGAVQGEPARESSASSRDLQFGVGYIVALTSVIAIMITIQRFITATSEVPSWSIVFLFGWTFFVYAVLAALLIATSILTTRRRRFLGWLAIAYTLLGPLATLPILGARGSLAGIRSEHVLNLYGFALGLSGTLAVVVFILRGLGYRLRYGRL
jgi:hypothetical protein